ncbi:MAG: 30S ribosomal protein S7 [Candidatus Harrisonbacteria bacterium CG10_big_fil_rev_8_21_14_0_10_42_17]|uniref:Small ribosomal subunit protein uS7 n=1 Tax=Candidatus Harrisonbacteria bacterium CG10_big_fil_rev_8_21_14_0_10_42_17 TaxID=1974584 RepID=A0A2M6WHL1_9BACT|nr:MAG: 30S ribosomal protein S7 [Candidatus Harrisonbacteria bacterium CG10_big_fil_rev_8_21_14_0_10_42_17]
MRKKRTYRKYFTPDYVYDSVVVHRFINYLMLDGKRTVAERVFYDAMRAVEDTTKIKPLEIFEKALENATPALEVSSRRIGGANYQVPREVRMERKFMLAARWVITAARAKKGMPMAKRLADELIAASNNEGAAVKKKQETHRMAEANRAFAHFARR